MGYNWGLIELGSDKIKTQYAGLDGGVLFCPFSFWYVLYVRTQHSSLLEDALSL